MPVTDIPTGTFVDVPGVRKTGTRNSDNSVTPLVGLVGQPLTLDPTNLALAANQATALTALGAIATLLAALAPIEDGVQNKPQIHHSFSYTADGSGAVWTPASGKRICVEGLVITPTAAGALLKIYDQTNSATTVLYVGQPPLGSIVIIPAKPWKCAAANNVLSWATGDSATGDVSLWGYEE